MVFAIEPIGPFKFESNPYTLTLASAEAPKTAPKAVSKEEHKLIGWWKFDETEGSNASDSSGKNYTGKLVGNPKWQPTGGKIGGALLFDGNDDYIELPIGSLLSTLSSGTFAIWVNWSGEGEIWQRIFDFGNDTNVYMFLTPRMAEPGQMYFSMTTKGGSGAAEPSQLKAPSTLATGWHHISVVIDGVSRTMQLYLDGVSIASGKAAALPADLGNTTNNWLGKSQYSWDPYFKGSLDDFRIYNYALPEAEIAAIYSGKELPGPASIEQPGKGRNWIPVLIIVIIAVIAAGLATRKKKTTA